jgi:hypothetical protein
MAVFRLTHTYNDDYKEIPDYTTTIMGSKMPEYMNQSDDHVVGLRPVASGKKFTNDSEGHTEASHL